MGSSPQYLRSPSPFPAFAYSRTKRHLLFFGGAGGSSSGGGSTGVAVRWAFECADALRRGREKWRTSDSPAALVEARSPTVLLPLHCHALRRRWTAPFYEMRGSFDLNVLESESIRHVLRFASSSSRFFFDCTMSGQREGEHELVDPRCQKERTEAMALAREERGEEREAERQGARGG